MMIVTLCTLIALTAHALCAAPTTPGTLDTTFNPSGNPAGTKITSFGNQTAEAYSVAMQTDGKIIVAGFYGVSAENNSVFAIARYNTDGSPDTTFDGDGKVTTSIGLNATSYSIAIQPDGKIVLAGASQSFVIARYLSNGSLDSTTFGTGGNPAGTVITSISGGGIGRSVILQPDNKIVVAGYTSQGGRNVFAVARYLSNGNLDSTTFGTGGNPAGTVTTAFGADFARGNSAALQADGKIIVAGYYGPLNGPGRVFALARYNTDGSLDTSFDGDGKVTTTIGTDAQAYTVAIQPDGKIIAAGEISDGNPGSSKFALTRYNTDGSLDTTFGTNGIVITNVSAGSDGINSITIQQDGKIVAAGQVSSNNQIGIARYNTNGSLDTTFNPTGTTPGINTTSIADTVSGQSVALQQDGKIVVAGYQTTIATGERDFAVARYNNIGALIDLSGKQTEVRFISQADLVNSLYWQAVTYATSYRITANGQALATAGVPNIDIHDTRPGNRIAYTVTPLNANGDEGVPASITLG